MSKIESFFTSKFSKLIFNVILILFSFLEIGFFVYILFRQDEIIVAMDSSLLVPYITDLFLCGFSKHWLPVYFYPVFYIIFFTVILIYTMLEIFNVKKENYCFKVILSALLIVFTAQYYGNTLYSPVYLVSIYFIYALINLIFEIKNLDNRFIQTCKKSLAISVFNLLFIVFIFGWDFSFRFYNWEVSHSPDSPMLIILRSLFKTGFSDRYISDGILLFIGSVICIIFLSIVLLRYKRKNKKIEINVDISRERK